MPDYNAPIIEQFRASAGKPGGYFGNMDLLLLTATGRRSGKSYTRPLSYTTDGDRIVIIASKGGSPTNPDWFHNLLANPEVTVELGAEKFKARAHRATGKERERLYNQHAHRYPVFNDYKAKTAREIPVFTLEREPDK